MELEEFFQQRLAQGREAVSWEKVIFTSLLGFGTMLLVQELLFYAGGIIVACPMAFEEFIYETRWAPGHGWTSCLQGPALACRSWIPFCANRDELDDCELKENWESDPAIPLVLNAGNGRPNEQFYRKDEFVQNLQLKDYRAAIGIDQPTLYLDKDRRVVGVTFFRFAVVGYTPWRVGSNVYYFPGKKEWDDGGVGKRPEEATIEWCLKFKLGWMANVVTCDETLGAICGCQTEVSDDQFRDRDDGCSGISCSLAFGLCGLGATR